ncbi:MAG: glycoside hydrolase family 3 domain protein, partial [Spirosoma sp.]|nr:glycoside hydrolase family 3 domain protein [Spirosoma sp.]
NETKTLPLAPRTKVYFESYYQQVPSRPGPAATPNPAASASKVFADDAKKYNLEFVKTPEEADVVLLWITPGSKSLFASDGSPIYLSLSKNQVDVSYINALTAKKPTILAINYTNPWVIDEVYNATTQGRIKGIIATFGTTTDALLDIVTGKFKPTGKMPFTTPVSEAAVQAQKTDVPGYLEGPGYALLKYAEGLHY